MYRTVVVTDLEERPRFCGAAGFPLHADAVARQAPDFSCFLENAAGQAVARCSLWWRQTPAHEGHTVGYLGHYAVTEAAAAPALFDIALERLAAERCTLAIGPIDGNTWQRYRLITERGAEPPFFLEPDNPDEWPGQFSAAGFTPFAQYYSALNSDLTTDDPRLPDLERKIAERGITVQPLRAERFDEEMRRVHALSLISFRANLLYTPIDEVDFLAQYTPIRPHLRPELVLLAEQRGELIGFIFAIPNLLQAQLGRPMDTAIIKTMAVHPEHGGIGLGSLLMARCEQAVRAAGFTRAIHALFHEANRSGRISSHTAAVIRRYTLFGREVRGKRRGTSEEERVSTLPLSANLAHTLIEQARLRPNAPAIIDTLHGRSRTTTFSELDLAAGRVARLLTNHGLQAGDAVLVFHPMSAELYIALLALFRLRLVAMFLDPSAGRAHIERCCFMFPPKALIAGTKAHLLRLLVPALRRIPVKIVIGWPLPFTVRWSAADRLEPLTEVRECDADTPALLTFTSGSTGQPKGTVRSHGLLGAQYRALAASLDLTAGDVDLATLPIVALANLGSGVTSLIPDADLRYPGAVAPAPIFAQVNAHQATTSVASPAFFECLVRHSEASGMVLPSLKKLFTGGAPVFPHLLDQMHSLAPNADIVALYGSTEAEPIAHVSRREVSADDLQAMLAGKGLLAGLPVEEIRLRILRDQWGTPVGPYSAAEFAGACCGVNEPGEIVVNGEHVVPGYLRGEGDEETKFRVDGAIWHRTGDAGYLDERGRLWLLGRCVARIHDAHGDLYPFAAETAAYQNPRVRRAALVAQRGKRILAVEFYEKPTTADLDALRAVLAWAHLDEVLPCPRIPVDKRHNAKIDYPSLYRMLEHSV